MLPLRFRIVLLSTCVILHDSRTVPAHLSLLIINLVALRVQYDFPIAGPFAGKRVHPRLAHQPPRPPLVHVGLFGQIRQLPKILMCCPVQHPGNVQKGSEAVVGWVVGGFHASSDQPPSPLATLSASSMAWSMILARYSALAPRCSRLP